MNTYSELRQPVVRSVTLLLYVSTLVVLLIAWAPGSLWVAFVVSAARAALFLGYWPHYGHPDPKDLPPAFGPIPAWVETASLPVAAAILASLSLFAFRRAIPKRWWLTAAAVLLPLAWALAYGLARVDPAGVLAWAFD